MCQKCITNAKIEIVQLEEVIKAVKQVGNTNKVAKQVLRDLQRGIEDCEEFIGEMEVQVLLHPNEHDNEEEDDE